MVDDSGLDTEKRDDGMWRWTWQSPGGAFYLGNYTCKSKTAAMKAGRAWLADFEQR